MSELDKDLFKETGDTLASEPALTIEQAQELIDHLKQRTQEIEEMLEKIKRSQL